MSEIISETSVVINKDRGFEVGLMTCIVTRQLDNCIRVKLGEVQNELGQTAEIFGQFSEAALTALLTDLQTAPFSDTGVTPEQVRGGTEYSWIAYYEDGSSASQYPADGGPETPLSLVEFPRVQSFWVRPRFNQELPWYGLGKERGFQRLDPVAVTSTVLDVPFPKGQEWQWNYYRKNWLQFGPNAQPPRTVQVIGWQIGDVICEIAVESSSEWQVWQKTPLGDPLLEMRGDTS